MISSPIVVGRTALAVLVVAGAVGAQFPRGLGAARLSFPGSNPASHVLDAQAIAAANAGYTNLLGPNGGLGVARTPNGHFFASFRRDLPTTAHQIFEFDAEGNWVGAYAQPSGTAGSEWGIRDLAWDGDSTSRSVIYGGCEYQASGDRIFAFDWRRRVFVPSRDVVVAGSSLQVARALAFVPPHPSFPLSPNGVLVVADFFGPIELVDVATGLMLSAPIPAVQPGTFGAAYDPVRETVWFGGQIGSQRSAPTGVVFSEMDLSGQATGQKFLGDLTIPYFDVNVGSIPGGLCGGVELFTGASGEPVLVYMAQATSDSIVTLHGRFEFGQGCTPARIGFDGEPFQGSGDFTVTLDDVPAGVSSVFIWVGVPSAPPGVPVPPFLASCPLLLDPAVSLLPIATPIPVVGGSATFPLPLGPGTAGFEGAFQFVVPAPVTFLPADFSKGGMIFINRP